MVHRFVTNLTYIRASLGAAMNNIVGLDVANKWMDV